jgi:hypothetical protein
MGYKHLLLRNYGSVAAGQLRGGAGSQQVQNSTADGRAVYHARGGPI